MGLSTNDNVSVVIENSPLNVVVLFARGTPAVGPVTQEPSGQVHVSFHVAVGVKL
jgi:hypothetical protein